MAARRIAKSAVDWAAFAERVPPNQREVYRAFKAKSEAFVNRVHQFPEKLPSIDFSMYKSRLASPAMVDQFEKAYQALNIPYPKDKINVMGVVEREEQENNEEIKQSIQTYQNYIKAAKIMLEKLETIPPPNMMTLEMFDDYFPHEAINPNKPTMWPHTPMFQPENNPNAIN